MKRVLRVIIVLALVLTAALIYRVRALQHEDQGPPGGTGVIEGVDVNVTSRLAARILKVNVREGDLVKQGDVLVDLDCTIPEATLAEAKARLAAAEVNVDSSSANAALADKNAVAARGGITVADSQLKVLEAQEKLARLDLERARTLVAQGASTAQAVDSAESRLDTLTSQIAAQRASVDATRSQAGAVKSAGNVAKVQIQAAQTNIDVVRASVARADADVKECTLLAPLGGIVSSRNFEPGEAVQPGSAVLAITDLSEARVRFYLQNADLAAAAPGRKVKVEADAYPKQIFSGTIIYISPRAEFTPRNVQTRDDRERLVYAVEVRIPNKDMRLRSGMPVEVAIEGAK
jgi:HlyD family secretion protein